MKKLAQALNQEISIPRVELYSEALRDLDEAPLRHAFECALRGLGEFMPSIAILRDYADSWHPTAESRRRKFNSVADIDPAKCPNGWTPKDVFRAHLTQQVIRDQVQ